PKGFFRSVLLKLLGLKPRFKMQNSKCSVGRPTQPDLPQSRVKTHCTEYRSTSCLPCVDGTYTDRPNGLEQCTPCTSCDSGMYSGLKVKRSCTVVSDTVCEPLQGFYCIYSVGDGCETAQRHSSCGPGQYISKHGRFVFINDTKDCLPVLSPKGVPGKRVPRLCYVFV
uniref:TNFR-Cys domain-containing protein n=1 Tax=Amphilophus citrinellus TaxID=61819 RepID=A0A3Q0T609_AMPCI